ncbi:MAG TPA: hypothetical protein PKA00_13765 [Saprospiraceae bacterium]|nr:hypothetical protein [Saprospiraceae bacterium]HMQ83978.1 hypothetical protein [Saprospiraceae bacterium]
MLHRLIVVLLCIGLSLGCRDKAPPSSTPQDNNIGQDISSPEYLDRKKDFESLFPYGIINGSQAPDSVSITENQRFFRFGKLEVWMEGYASLSGETIKYKTSTQKEWQTVEDEPFLYFLGYDGDRYLVLDQGEKNYNRELRLYDFSKKKAVFYSRYNNSIIKKDWLYLLRLAESGSLDTLPECPAQPHETVSYEEVVALHLSDLKMVKTGQVFCLME